MKLRSRMGIVVILMALPVGFAAAAQQAIPLWSSGAPGSEGKMAEESVWVTERGEHVIFSVHRPSVTAYLPAKEKASGTAVIIAPGGGHVELWMDHEGYNVAKWLSEQGTAAFVLKYRLAREKGSTYSIEGNELADIQRAIRMVRSRAAEWGIESQRVGVMGFSAGGELATLASLQYDDGVSNSADLVERKSSKPAFQALIYPGLPRDRTVSKETPPAFLVCGENDRADISQGLPEFYLALKRAGVSAELHVYAGTGHGFGMRESNRPPVSGWLRLFLEWLDGQGFLKHK